MSNLWWEDKPLEEKLYVGSGEDHVPDEGRDYQPSEEDEYACA